MRSDERRLGHDIGSWREPPMSVTTRVQVTGMTPGQPCLSLTVLSGAGLPRWTRRRHAKTTHLESHLIGRDTPKQPTTRRPNSPANEEEAAAAAAAAAVAVTNAGGRVTSAGGPCDGERVSAYLLQHQRRQL